jgi:hypothetical protein
LVEFKFKGRGYSTALNEKNIDLNQTIDSPLAFLKKDGTELKLTGNLNDVNLYSPIDGEPFLNVKAADKTASVKPLILTFEVPVFSTDPETGAPVEEAPTIIVRTFDNIPKLVIMDDEFNVYFIEPNGIQFDNDGLVESISAKIVNTVAAPKHKASREEVELDTNNDGIVDSNDDGSTLKILDFPQLYFFDMRQAGEQLEQFCNTASINSFPFEDNNTEEIEDIVEATEDCVQTYLDGVRGLVGTVRDAQVAGTLPVPEISIDEFEGVNQTFIDCLTDQADAVCKFVVNGLNTSFKVLEDDDETPLPEFVDGDISDEILEDFESIGPPFTGAREYASGIGDSASIGVGDSATIQIIPRDSYDDEIIGDLTEKITLEIVGDTTGAARFIRNDDGSILTKSGTEYTAILTSNNIGEVKLRSRVCDRTIQALTFSGIEPEVIPPEVEVDCVPDTVAEITGTTPPLGALTKADRILSVFFVKKAALALAEVADSAELPNTQPQQFGTELEN